MRKTIVRTGGPIPVDGLATTTNTAERQMESSLRELRERREKIGDQLGAFERANENREEIRQIKAEIEAMESELEQQKQEARMNKSGETPTTMRKSAEDLMDRYAESIRKSGETFEVAYTRACQTDMGASILDNIEDAYRQQTGQMTSSDIKKMASI